MGKKKGSIGSVKSELLSKAKEAALCAIKVYNDPLVKFRAETFTVLMIVAWTYLLHAFYRSRRIDYRYFEVKGSRRRYDRTKHGAYKHWELERCLNDANCPIDDETQKNLRFLIGLRHEIEHQMARGVDSWLSSRFQACAFNFNEYLAKLLGKDHRLDEYVQFSIQFAQLDPEQFLTSETGLKLPKALASYVQTFDRALSEQEFNSPRFAYRLLFTKKLVNRPGQADRLIEFVDAKCSLAESINKEYWVKKEVERPKFLPKDVVKAVHKAGFPKFRIQPEHVEMWKAEDAKNPAKGYGVSVAGQWYWYQNWVDRCIELCRKEGDKVR